MYKQLLEEIKKHDSIIVLRHINPDPDALGSQFGLARLIQDNFKDKQVLCGGHDISNLQGAFFPMPDDISDETFAKSLVIVCDTANGQRVDDQRYKHAKTCIKFDHHPPKEDYGTYQVVDDKSNATCQMVVSFIMSYESQLHVSQACATYLYMGLVSDTGRYLHNTVTANTLQAGAFLLEKKAVLSDVHEALYLRETNEIKLQAYILSNFDITSKGLAYYYLTDNTIASFGVELEVAKEFVHVLGNLKAAKIWVSFTYDNNQKEYRCSIRSRHIKVSDVAHQFGGGGHAFASGVRLSTQAECEKLLETLNNLL